MAAKSGPTAPIGPATPIQIPLSALIVSVLTIVGGTWGVFVYVASNTNNNVAEIRQILDTLQSKSSDNAVNNARVAQEIADKLPGYQKSIDALQGKLDETSAQLQSLDIDIASINPKLEELYRYLPQKTNDEKPK